MSGLQRAVQEIVGSDLRVMRLWTPAYPRGRALPGLPPTCSAPCAGIMNRLLIESLLTAPERQLLKRMCGLLGLPNDRWMAVPPLRQLFETRSWWRLGERIHVEEGVPMPAALKRAAVLLGRNPRTIARRFRRWIEAGVVTKCRRSG